MERLAVSQTNFDAALVTEIERNRWIITFVTAQLLVRPDIVFTEISFRLPSRACIGRRSSESSCTLPDWLPLREWDGNSTNAIIRRRCRTNS